MPITVISGTPGAGKTLLALDTILKELKINGEGMSPEEIKAAVHAQTVRPVVCIGVEGLMPDLFETWEDPYGWQDAEDGTLFLVDEAWKWFGSHDLTRKQDPRVLALAEHRHRGMDFIFTCQGPAQLIPHVRMLCSPHIHVTRKFGSTFSLVYTWPHTVDEPNSIANKDRAQEAPFTQPKHVFDLYKSATMHTIKRKIPAKLIAMVGAAVAAFAVVGVAAYFGWSALAPVVGDAGAAPAALASPSPGARSSRSDAPPSSAEEWLAQFEPRVPGVPWSAPAYDDREPSEYPRPYCIGGDLTDARADCQCFTQQGTRLPTDPMLCRLIIRDGLFDPYRREDRERERPRTAEANQVRSPGERRRALGSGRALGSTIRPEYVPPVQGEPTRPTASGYVGGR